MGQSVGLNGWVHSNERVPKRMRGPIRYGDVADRSARTTPLSCIYESSDPEGCSYIRFRYPAGYLRFRAIKFLQEELGPGFVVRNHSHEQSIYIFQAEHVLPNEYFRDPDPRHVHRGRSYARFR